MFCFFPLCKINLQLLLFRLLVNLRILRSITSVGGGWRIFSLLSSESFVSRGKYYT
jgi:hypothetical protein